MRLRTQAAHYVIDLIFNDDRTIDAEWNRGSEQLAKVALGRVNDDNPEADVEYRCWKNEKVQVCFDGLELEDANSQAAKPEMTRCVVADPTGTPLNVRTSANGKVVSTLSNGEVVGIIERTTAHGKKWVYVTDEGKRPLGWVFERFITCD